jgi:hypothetical protein
MTPKDRVNLYASEPLGIFDVDVKESSDAPKIYIWDRLMKDELERIGAQPPSNSFEEMICWTKQEYFGSIRLTTKGYAMFHFVLNLFVVLTFILCFYNSITNRFINKV